MINNACKAEDLSCSSDLFTSTKFIISSCISSSQELHAAICEKREGFRLSKEGGESRNQKTVFGEGFVLLN